jgi:hypothetical protein
MSLRHRQRVRRRPRIDRRHSGGRLSSTDADHDAAAAVRGNHYPARRISGCTSSPGVLATTRDSAAPSTAGARGRRIAHRSDGRARRSKRCKTQPWSMTRGPRGDREYESDTFRLDQPLIDDARS